MNFSVDYIKGTCNQMCPEEEINMRKREGLIHILEVLPGIEGESKAGKHQMVKSFSRSAAGKMMQEAKNIRPPNVLLKTVNYLLDDIVSREDLPWTAIYDFVMDRLRSVRQDLVIQNASRAHYISILQPIVRFHAYASYRLCEENIKDFDAYINNKHLQECLKRLLCTYDDIDELSNTVADTVNIFNEYLEENRPQFEALYIVLNLGNSVAITRGLNLSKMWRTDLVKICLEMSIAYSNNNFVRVCRLLQQLPVLHAAVTFLHLSQLRRTALKIMSTAYSSKNLSFPVSVMRELLVYDTDNELVKDCGYYGITVKENVICYSKATFNESKPVMPTRRSQYIDHKLEDTDISILILFGG